MLVGAGALGASVNAASGRAIMAWFPATELGLALGIRQTAIPIGGALGAALLPVLASTGGTHLAFLFLAGACLTGAIVAAAFIRGGAAPSRRSATSRSRCATPSCGGSGRGRALYLLAQIGITGFVVLFLHEERGLSKEAAGAVLAGIYVLAIAARIGSGTDLRPARQPARPAADDRRRARAAHRRRRRRRSTRRSRSSSRCSSSPAC